ncbi:RadC family protein [Thermodesulfobacteriota bacterium]
MEKEVYDGLKVRVQLVREGSALEYPKSITSSHELADLVSPRLEPADREFFLSILLNQRLIPVGVEEVAIGGQNASIILPREVFRSALLAGASALILCHNHPSGFPDPSPEDRTITKRLKDAGEFIGVKVVDHIIIGHGIYYSFADQGEI